jgi:biopolymer transport protein ExbD
VRIHPLLLVLLLVLLITSPAASWAEPAQHRFPPSPGQKPTPEDEDRIRMEKEMAKKLNLERQEQLKRDTEKLLKLATELKQYVDKTNENMLSLEVLKKAAEIEKLAHSVREKMKGD